MLGFYYWYTGKIRGYAHKASFLLHHLIQSLFLAVQPALPRTGGFSNSAHPHCPWEIPNSFSCYNQVHGGEGTHKYLGLTPVLNIWLPLWVWWEGTQATPWILMEKDLRGSSKPFQKQLCLFSHMFMWNSSSVKPAHWEETTDKNTK